MRSMELKYSGKTIYRSTFDPKTGALVRLVEIPSDRYRGFDDHLPEDKAFKETWPRADFFSPSFSPVPETVDVTITDKCRFGCTYCYMDSTPDKEHAPKELVETIIQGFDQPPYQMAIGGGEPTLHPDFPYILRKCRELGTVPNYTTAGGKLSPRVVEATNEVCGGVAMTYHAFKGIDWFVEHYTKLREALTVQVNVHLIANKDVAKNLHDLVSKVDQIGKINLVLLAYYPDVGRASLDNLVTKHVYMRHFPDAIRAAQGAGFQIAFSEGLMPYFLSRPELGVETRFSMRSEGLFSCYVDSLGRMTKSSFEPAPEKDGRTVYNMLSQKMWANLRVWGGEPNGASCYKCRFSRRCATPHDFHYLLCNYASHNSGRPTVEGGI